MILVNKIKKITLYPLLIVLLLGSFNNLFANNDEYALENLENKIISIETEIQSLTDKIELLSFQYENLLKEIKYLISKENKQEKLPLNQNNTKNSESNIYQIAFEALQQGDYQKAILEFENFIKANENDQLSSEAYYWLAESYFAQSNYNKAAINFIYAINKSTQNNIKQNSMLKLGKSLIKLNKIQEACKNFNNLKNNFSNLPSQLLSELEKDASSVNCKLD